MEYDSAMKTRIIVDRTLVNLEVKIKQAKENTHKAKNKSYHLKSLSVRKIFIEEGLRSCFQSPDWSLKKKKKKEDTSLFRSNEDLVQP